MKRLSLFIDRDSPLGAGTDLTDPTSPLAPYFTSAGGLLATAIIALTFAFLNLVPLNHTDVWAHVRFGEILIDRQTFQTHEALSQFAESVAAPSNNAWLSQALFAGFFRAGESMSGADPIARLAGGVDGLRFLHSVLVATRFWFLFIAFRRAAHSRMVAAFGLLAIALLGIGSLGVLRPQVIGEMFFAAVLIPLSRSLVSTRSIALIPVVMVAWANAHGSFLVGLLALGICWAARMAELLMGAKSQSNKLAADVQLRRLTMTIAVSVVAIGVLNPDGMAIYANTLGMANNPNVRLMDEWRPLWASEKLFAQCLFAICMLLVIASIVISGTRLRALTILMLGAFAAQAGMHQRGLIWLFTVAPWLAMPYLGMGFVRYRPVRFVSVPSFRKSIAAGMVSIIAVLWSLPGQRMTGSRKPELAKSVSEGTPWQQALAVVDPESVPNSPLTKAIRATFPDGRFTGAVYTGDTLGDFFVWRMPVPAPVYMYSHVHLFSPDHWRSFAAIRDTALNWQNELAVARVNLIVIRPALEPALCQAISLDPAWTVITDETRLLSKYDPRNRLFVALRKQPLASVIAVP